MPFSSALVFAPSVPPRTDGSEPTDVIIHVGLNAARAAVPSIWAVADVTPKKTTSSQPSDFILVICEVNGATCWPEKYDTVGRELHAGGVEALLGVLAELAVLVEQAALLRVQVGSRSGCSTP